MIENLPPDGEWELRTVAGRPAYVDLSGKYPPLDVDTKGNVSGRTAPKLQPVPKRDGH